MKKWNKKTKILVFNIKTREKLSDTVVLPINQVLVVAKSTNKP